MRCYQGLAFRQGGLDLYSGSGDGTVKVWNVSERAYVETLFGHQSGVVSVDCLAGERPLTAGGFDRSVRIFKVPEETHLVFNGHTAPIDVARYVTDSTFVTGSQDGSLCLWDTSLKRPRATIQQAHGGTWITALASAPSTDLVASAASDGIIRLWQCHAKGLTQAIHSSPFF